MLRSRLHSCSVRRAIFSGALLCRVLCYAALCCVVLCCAWESGSGALSSEVRVRLTPHRHYVMDRYNVGTLKPRHVKTADRFCERASSNEAACRIVVPFLYSPSRRRPIPVGQTTFGCRSSNPGVLPLPTSSALLSQLCFPSGHYPDCC